MVNLYAYPCIRSEKSWFRRDEYAKERREQKNLRTHLLRICVFGATKSQPKTLETKKSLNAS